MESLGWSCAEVRPCSRYALPLLKVFPLLWRCFLNLSLTPSFPSEDGDLLSMVPPTIEALMDIMESSRDLSELLGNDAAPDVVDQTRGLVEQVIKKV